MPARVPAAHPEVLENALLEALRDGMPPGSVDRLRRLLEAHIEPVSRGAVEVETGLARSQQTGVATFRASFFVFLARDYLPPLEHAILAAAPLPRLDADDGGAAAAPALNVVEAAELLVVLSRLLERRGIATTVTLGIGDALMRAAGAFAAALAAALDGPAPPEMRALTRELGKLEILRWLLEVLRTPDYRRVLSTQLQVCARRALRRATAAIERFLVERRADARREIAGLTAEIEDLVALVLLLLDAEREDAVAEADNPFFRELGRAEVGAFAGQATQLAELMFDELDALAPAALAGAPPAQLRQVMILASFASRLDAYVTLEEVEQLRRTIARRRAALEARGGAARGPR
jgi:hypothetical protein